MELRPFQKTFLTRALSNGVDTSVLSLPRGNGKSTLSAYILERCLTPGDDLFEAGAEYLLGAASLEQARNAYRPLRAALEDSGEYRFIDSVTRLGITHVETNTKLRVLSSNAKTAFGIVGSPLAILDEPGSWEVSGGSLMYDALVTAQGKPLSRLRLIFVGTLAPSSGGWWTELVEGGSHGSTYVQSLQGERASWDKWASIRRANPLMALYKDSRAKLIEERDAARADSRLKARFLSYRLNIPATDESVTLLTLDDWARQAARPTPPATDRPIVAVDLGAGRAFSAAVAIWKSGRAEALAVAPGIPDIAAQEKRDHVPALTYENLRAEGRLSVAEGLRVQPASALWDSVVEHWGAPVKVVCDRFRIGELQDAIKGGCPIEPRMTRWSESSEDIRALRRMALDGPLVVSPESRSMVSASMARATVLNDDAGNCRLQKHGSGNTARDDVAAALVLCAGAWERASARPAGQLTHVVIP